MTVTKRTFVVTGAGAGLGREIALAAAMDGAHVIVNDITQERAEMVVAEITAQTGSARAAVGDVTSFDDVESLAHVARDWTGRVDVLVNNAGVFELPPKPTVDQDPDWWQRVIDVHLRGTYLCSRQMAKDFFLPQRFGRIVNMASVAGMVGLPKRNAYSAAKAGVIMMTRTMASEWARDGITVNAVAPGYILTQQLSEKLDRNELDVSELRRRTPVGELGRPQDISRAVMFMASPDSSYITGACLPVDGGYHAFGGAGNAADIA